ncbi:hypothetical protein [Yoonia sp. R2-816]|uniref:hypothetical protein n=1 Tax=Yoonia sp. R2-816 TaxID=3342638 RepID=UPI00372C644B
MHVAHADQVFGFSRGALTQVECATMKAGEEVRRHHVAERVRAAHINVHAMETPWHGGSWRVFVDQFQAASENLIRLQITYEDESGNRSERAVRPLGGWFWGKVVRLGAGVNCAMISECSG